MVFPVTQSSPVRRKSDVAQIKSSQLGSGLNACGGAYSKANGGVSEPVVARIPEQHTKESNA
jgi:hypothetical protein